MLFMQSGSIAKWKDGNVTHIIKQLPEVPGQHFNDVIADPAGRVFRGSVSPDMAEGKKVCNLYCIDVDGSIKLVGDDIGFSNGLAFSPDCKQLYLADTTMHQIYVYDYDITNGKLANRRTFKKINPDEGNPDGITVDSFGYVWVALFWGSCVVRYTPHGIEERRIHFPAKHITSITFGSNDLTEIYVTSAKDGPEGEDSSEAAGSLFNLPLGIRGVPEFFSRIQV
jgi:D-xylono/L-arabinono-1,4-lactonase